MQARLASTHARNLDDALAEVGRQVDAKSALIDDFKAQNSLFKNSLRYVPTAHRQIQAIAATTAQTDLGRRIGFLVNESLRFGALPDDEVAASLRTGIGELRSAISTYPEEAREAVLNLLSHLDTLLRLRANQSELLHAISRQPVAASIDALSGALTQRFSNELAVQFRYHRLLLAYSAFALLLVIGGTSFIGYRNTTERRRLSALVDAQTRELRELATRDDLTGIHNRRHIGQLLEQQQALHQRSGLPMSIALLDLDRFKSINDRYGHAAGDAVLARAAGALREAAGNGTALRWGGEEFLVVLELDPGVDPATRAQHLVDAVRATEHPVGGRALSVSASVGWAVWPWNPQHPRQAGIDQLLTLADQALYRAKRDGRNRCAAAWESVDA